MSSVATLTDSGWTEGSINSIMFTAKKTTELSPAALWFKTAQGKVETFNPVFHKLANE